MRSVDNDNGEDAGIYTGSIVAVVSVTAIVDNYVFETIGEVEDSTVVDEYSK